MILRPSATFTAGNLRYNTHAASVFVRRGVLPTVDRVEYRLPAGVRMEAKPADDVELELDGGEGGATAFTGFVTSTGSSATGSRIVAHNGGTALARFRPSSSLEKLKVSDVVKKLCAEAEVQVKVSGGPTLARYVSPARSTALDEVTRLLHLAGQVGAFDSKGKLMAYEDAPANEVALKYGREILSFETSAQPYDTSARVLSGEGAGGPRSANALWPTDDFWKGGAPSPGVDSRLRVAHELRSTGEAKTAGAAWGSRSAAIQASVKLVCWLLPSIGPNALIKVQDAPGGLGDVRVRQVVHRIDPARGATTSIWGYDEGAASQDLLSGLLSAIGSLL